MEDIYEALKEFITGKMPEYLAKKSTEKVPCPPIQEGAVVFGTVDVSRIQQKCVVSVMPDFQEDGEGELASWKPDSSLTVTFILSGAPYDVLVRRMVRYPAAFREAVLDDPTLSGKVEDVKVGKRTFHPDCGTSDMQMTACEVELEITTDEEIPVEKGVWNDG